jgi:hypothetical protein
VTAGDVCAAISIAGMSIPGYMDCQSPSDGGTEGGTKSDAGGSSSGGDSGSDSAAATDAPTGG